MTHDLEAARNGCVEDDDSTAGAACDRRNQVLQLLRASDEPRSIAELARAIGVHVNTVRFHLDALAASGLVERANDPPRGPGRPPLRYRARRVMDPTGPRSFQLLAAILAEKLASEPNASEKAIDAGRSWGSRMLTAQPGASVGHDEAVVRLTGLLDELGFKPELSTTRNNANIALRHCPFLELANTRAEVVCPIHLGLMQGALSSLASDTSVEKLEPFAQPDMCMAHVYRAKNQPRL